MDITPYVDSLRRDLLAAAEAGGDEARQVAERLSYALDASARLALMEAISQAAAEISTELPAGRRRRPAQRPRARLRRRGRPDRRRPDRPRAAGPAPSRGGRGGRPRPHHPPHPRVDQGPRRGEGRRRRPEPQHLARLDHPGRHLRPRDQRRHRPLEHPVLRPRPLQGRQPRQPPHDRLALTGTRAARDTRRPQLRQAPQRSSTQAGPWAEHTLETPMDHTFDTPDPIELYVEIGKRPHRRHRHRHRHHHRDRHRRARRGRRGRAARRPGRGGGAPHAPASSPAAAAATSSPSRCPRRARWP